MHKNIKSILSGLALSMAMICQPVFASTTQTAIRKTIQSQDQLIRLTGDLAKHKKDSQDAIEVQSTSGGLLVQFNADLGSITIEVTDSNGVVYYQNTVSSTLPHVLNISTAGWPAGTYTITFYNNNGMAEGDFNV